MPFAYSRVPFALPRRAPRRYAVRVLRSLEYRILRRYSTDASLLSDSLYHERSKLRILLGEDIFQKMRGKIVVDFGCGYGEQTIELAQQGVKHAIGVDIREEILQTARAKAAAYANVTFTTPDRCDRGFADTVISLDSFEHFADPQAALALMYDLLAPGGTLLASFGPPWLHPLGGHAFSMFPWAHLVLSEQALCRWYNETRKQHITRFEDVSGGLNRMTVAKFERLVCSSPFSSGGITLVPIRRLRSMHNRLTREFTTSVVKCELKK